MLHLNIIKVKTPEEMGKAAADEFERVPFIAVVAGGNGDCTGCGGLADCDLKARRRQNPS